MTSPNARKGKDFERDVTRFLAEVFGRQVRRPHAEGFEDVGDIHLSPFALQAKNYADVATALNVGVKGAEEQAVRAEEPFGAAVIKKRGASIAEARVAMSLRTFRRLIGRLRNAERLLYKHAPDEVFEAHVRTFKE